MSLILAIVFLVVATILVSGQLISYQPETDNVSANTQGVLNDEILIGASSALSGYVGYLGTSYMHGALSYLNKINEEGGIYGRKIRVVSYDDRYEPSQTILNTQRLINKDKVFALFNYVGTPTAVKVIPIVESAKIPLVGLFTGANALRSPVRHYIFNIRASYYQETEMAVKYFVDNLKLTRIAVFYQADVYGIDGFEGAKIALRKRELEPVFSAAYIRGTMDVEKAAEDILASDPEAIIMVGTYSPTAKFVKLVKKDSPNMLFHSVSFVGPEEFAKDLKGETDNVFVTQVVPPPKTSDYLEGVLEFKEYLKESYPDDLPNLGAFEGFVNAKVLVEGLKRSGRDLNRENFIDSLESIKDFSFGVDATVNFSEGNHQGLNRIYFTSIKDGVFVMKNINK